VQGNYDNSVGNNLADCQCGYTDAKDNYFARISYDYTFRNTAEENKRWMRDLPNEIRLDLNGVRVLLCHGSPRKMNEFLWETTTSPGFLERLCESHAADVIVGTHTGLHWHRALAEWKAFRELRRDRPASERREDECLVRAAQRRRRAPNRSRIHSARIRSRAARGRDADGEPAGGVRANHRDGMVDDLSRSSTDERESARMFLKRAPLWTGGIIPPRSRMFSQRILLVGIIALLSAGCASMKPSDFAG
jgi:hypothetical protein